jgi:hypothetical protein
VETNLLIELIEKITLEPLPFSDNKNLQKLLMLTAIQSHEAKVDRYVSKLENYDHLEIAHNLQEYNKHALTMSIPVEHIVSIERVLDYANKVDIPPRHSSMVSESRARLVSIAQTLNCILPLTARTPWAPDSYIKAQYVLTSCCDLELEYRTSALPGQLVRQRIIIVTRQIENRREIYAGSFKDIR